jgi:NAD(P)H-hydrate epimerase
VERVDRPAGERVIEAVPLPGPSWVLTPAQSAAVDAAAIRAGLVGAAMMETAGRAVADAIVGRWPEGRVVVFAGGGNNGGDGLVAARWLHATGRPVELALFFDPSRATGDAAIQWRLVEPLALPLTRVADPRAARAAVDGARGAAGVVDALLGTGLRGDVREPIRSAVEALDASGLPVVAVDGPSGLDGETGRIRGAAARAELTVTFGFPKPGQFLAAGPEKTGRLIVVPLGAPPAALAAAGEAPLEWIGLADAAAALPTRRHDAHKGAAGRLLVVAGSAAYRGAALLTATAALRSGAGICVVATPEPVVEALVAALPEAIAIALPVTKSGALSAKAGDLVAGAALGADAVAIGPGLSTGARVRALVEAALASPAPAVLDADALNVLARDPSPLARDAAVAITPHPGELGRWLGQDAAEVDAERIACAREAARRWGAHVVLKGSPTVVAEPGGGTALNLSGNPGLAVGGSGDVLTGLLGSLLAQGTAPALACRAAPFIHGLSADWASRDLGERGMTPGDLLRYLPLAIRDLEAGRGRELLAAIDHPRAALLGAGASR